MTLLEYIVNEAHQKGILNFTKDLKILDDVCKIDFDNVTKLLKSHQKHHNEMKNYTNKIFKTTIENENGASVEKDIFINMLKEYLTESEDPLSIYIEKWNSVLQSLKMLGRLLDRENKEDPFIYLSTLRQFCIDVEKIEQQILLKIARREQQKKQDEIKKQRRTRSKPSIGNIILVTTHREHRAMSCSKLLETKSTCIYQNLLKKNASKRDTLLSNNNKKVRGIRVSKWKKRKRNKTLPNRMVYRKSHINKQQSASNQLVID